jgi:hypothetical protein
MVLPYDSKLFNGLEIFNEVCFMILLYLMVDFSDFELDPYTKYNSGWAFIIVLLIVVVLNYFFLLFKMLSPLCLLLNKLFKKIKTMIDKRRK